LSYILEYIYITFNLNIVLFLKYFVEVYHIVYL